MKSTGAITTILLGICAFAMGAPQIHRDEEVVPPRPYAFNYTIRDQINAVMAARIEEGDSQGVIRGSYTYIRPDGIIQTTSYIADENGFRSETKEEPAGGLEIPDPSGTIQVAVNLPDAEPYSYQFTADEYKKLISKSKV
ncbi:cuticle protein 10.9-like [Macrobrachium nipponense]|uniref:cuticle protein 10.9-like n=1 Tax=Macrobrachium nipponense TaxID=159736 RepID=UPI0030C7B547